MAVAGTVGAVEHGERMNGNPVGTLHKKGLAVTIEGEALADGVLLLLQRHTPRLGFCHRFLGKVVIVALQSSAAENAHGAELWTPVPTQHVGSHTAHGAVVGQVVVHIGPGVAVLFTYFGSKVVLVILLDGVERYLQHSLVAEVGQLLIVEQDIKKAHPVFAEHIIDGHHSCLEFGAERLAAEPHIAVCGPIKHEVAVFKTLPHVAGDNGAVFPPSLADPLHGILVGGVEGVGNEVVCHKVGMDAARHLGGVPLVVVFKLPFSEFSNVHISLTRDCKNQHQ